MKKKISYCCINLVMFVLLAGCMYPENERKENQIPFDDQINTVQNAVEQFRKDEGGILPIKNQDATVPLYQKYPIDFKRLSKYMAEPPGNAYESGGVFQYVIVDAETNPTVKIFDLRIAEAIQLYKLRMSMYLDNNEYLPFKEQLHTNVFTLDNKKLGYDEEPVVKSPYSGTDLHIVIDSSRDIFIDYTPDLIQALEKDKSTIKNGDDIRNLLTKDSHFVPAFSLPYTVDENNKPVFMTK